MAEIHSCNWPETIQGVWATLWAVWSPRQLSSLMASLASTQDRPHLVSLVLQSKKALQHGQELCSLAHERSRTSSTAAFDILGLDAKVRWVIECIMEQLKVSSHYFSMGKSWHFCKLATSVGKTLEEKRIQLHKQVEVSYLLPLLGSPPWYGSLQALDADRSRYTGELDNILEALGAQHVPSEFYQTSSDSSIFGSQHSDRLNESSNKLVSPPSPSATVRDHTGTIVLPTSRSKHRSDRKHWKNLRDFVDDQAIEDILETIESNRISLDVSDWSVYGGPSVDETVVGFAWTDRRPSRDPHSGNWGYPYFITRAFTRNIAGSMHSKHPTSTGCCGCHYGKFTWKSSVPLRANVYCPEGDRRRRTFRWRGSLTYGISFEAVFLFTDHVPEMHRDVEELPSILSEIEQSGHIIDSHKCVRCPDYSDTDIFSVTPFFLCRNHSQVILSA